MVVSVCFLSGCNEKKDNKSTTPEITQYLSVKDVVTNSSVYISTAEEITVKGYYYTDYSYNMIWITDYAVIPGDPTPLDVLLVDHSGVENVELIIGNKYIFTGVLEEYGDIVNIKRLIASEIEPV